MMVNYRHKITPHTVNKLTLLKLILEVPISLLNPVSDRLRLPCRYDTYLILFSLVLHHHLKLKTVLIRHVIFRGPNIDQKLNPYDNVVPI